MAVRLAAAEDCHTGRPADDAGRPRLEEGGGAGAGARFPGARDGAGEALLLLRPRDALPPLREDATEAAPAAGAPSCPPSSSLPPPSLRAGRLVPVPHSDVLRACVVGVLSPGVPEGVITVSHELT